MITRNSNALRAIVASMVLAAPFMLSACGGNTNQPEASAPARGDCPVDPVKVVVSIDQWGDIVSELGGACADVTTVLASSSVDPHDYEPAPSDAARFDGAQLVVINGGHYDEWAAKLASTSAPDAPVISAVELGGEHEGDAGHEGASEAGHEHAGEGNPHVWYSPSVVTAVAEAVTARLGELAPRGVSYFDERHTEFDNAMKPYDDTIAAIKSAATGKGYAATETVFDEMGEALGLQNRTPEGYQVASSNESDPSPADLDAFLRLLGDRGVDVLIYNTQTEGSVPEQIRGAAEKAGVPVVDVTETLPPNSESFQAWQVGQLDALAKVFGVPA